MQAGLAAARLTNVRAERGGSTAAKVENRIKNSRQGWRWTGRHEFLCEPVPSLAAGVAVAGSGDALRQDAGGGVAAVPVEVGGVGEEFDAAGRAEPAQGGAIRVAADCQESGTVPT